VLMSRKRKNWQKQEEQRNTREVIKDNLVISDEMSIKVEKVEKEQGTEKKDKTEDKCIISLSDMEILTIYSVKFDQFEKLDMKNAPELITLHEGKLIIIPYDKKEPEKIIIKNTALALRLRAEYLPQNKVIILEPRPGSVRVNIPKNLQIEIV